MRLFVAILLEQPVREALACAMSRLPLERGRLTPRENLHLTLAFLGETSRLPAAREALGRVEFSPFRLTLEGMGRFRRGGGDLIWAGAAPCPPLLDLQRALSGALTAAGFSLESRPFRPHLTLAREAVLSPGAGLEGLLPPADQQVDRISQMRSERGNGRMIYTPLAHREATP